MASVDDEIAPGSSTVRASDTVGSVTPRISVSGGTSGPWNSTSCAARSHESFTRKQPKSLRHIERLKRQASEAEWVRRLIAEDDAAHPYWPEAQVAQALTEGWKLLDSGNRIRSAD